MRRLIFFFLGALPVAAGLCLNPTNSIAAATEPYGLSAMTQLDRLPDLKLDTMAGGQSSYDRSGANHDFGNFLYTNGTEHVLLDLTGPGTVYRIWCTGFNPATDYIKVYFDGETAPRINMLLSDLFSGTNAPFLTPLVGSSNVSSGGFYCYLPLPFSHSVKITSNGSYYYNIGYDIYSPDTSVTTWTGTEDSSAVRDLWNNAGTDPKADAGNVAVSNTFDLAAGATQTLLDVPGPRSISSIKLKIPGIDPQPPLITDTGRGDKGYTQFQLTINPTNDGVVLVRRLDYGVGNQKGDVYVDGTLAGQWFDAGSNTVYRWRDSSFSIPAVYTTNKSSITVKVVFVSSDDYWSEFHYWAYSLANGTTNLTDTLNIGNGSSESGHHYLINTQTFSGTRSYRYPPSGPVVDPDYTADLITNLWLRIAFNDETNPSVYAPIGSFFAMGQFASYYTRSLMVGLDSNLNLYCYFPMPFARRATVQLVSQRAETTTNIQYEIKYEPFTDSFANVGCFKTQFRAETPTTNGIDVVLLDTEGAGHLVGVVESMMGPTNRGYLEGDERFYVDDSHSPTFCGTGTEDFYNGGWYFRGGLFTLPVHGNTAHIANTNYDYTSAYRLFLQDAVPFRKHIQAWIEHGNEDTVPINVWSLAYYYYQPTDRAVLTDQLILNNAASEAAHSYSVNSPTWSGSRTYTYEYQGFWNTYVNSTGRAHKGYSQFTMALQPTNAGAILRRQFDQGIANQRADVYVDGSLVGPWYRAGGNYYHRWRDDDFMIPAAYTSGKSSVQIKVQFVSSDVDWEEFTYSLYTLAPPAQVSANVARFTGLYWAGPAGSSPFVLSFAGSTNASYDVWGSTNLWRWNWLGTATESDPGGYIFTDSSAPEWPLRFYHVVGP